MLGRNLFWLCVFTTISFHNLNLPPSRYLICSTITTQWLEYIQFILSRYHVLSLRTYDEPDCYAWLPIHSLQWARSPKTLADKVFWQALQKLTGVFIFRYKVTVLLILEKGISQNQQWTQECILALIYSASKLIWLEQTRQVGLGVLFI